MFKIERGDGTVVEVSADEVQGWMQNHAVRRADGTGRKPDVAVGPDGVRWVQVGYVMLSSLTD